ncbi:zonular occludens toxin domain-containing protein [Shewanella maritima]|uniref:zonular occludens toxin domain-containing protein n=1 Tax=Shewanella maritima TaxID=2520507 RepID=UPI0013EEE07D|nr:zonular occludens toxin domain-containing protein [Shewanella maritima]
MDACGVGYDGVLKGKFNDDEAGLMVLDEGAVWLNSRDYRNSDRGNMVKKVVHLRKQGWHVLLIVQDEEMLDKQARDALGEHVVYCQRTDRMKMPILGEWSKALGKKEIKPPKVHVGNVKYKTSAGMHTVDTWYYQGAELYNAYNTCQIFEKDSDIQGVCTVLPSWYIYGRYTNDTEHQTRRFNESDQAGRPEKNRPAFFTGAIVAGVLSWMFLPAEEVEASASVPESVKESVAELKPKHPLDGVFITASVKSTKSFDYVFESNNAVVYPEHHGYRVRYINECRANLIKDSESIYITCNAGRPIEATAQSREVSAPSESGEQPLDKILAPFKD